MESRTPTPEPHERYPAKDKEAILRKPSSPPKDALPGYSLQSLREHHDKSMVTWKSSAIYVQFKDFFESVLLEQKGIHITKAMFLGLGSLSSETYSGPPGHRMDDLVVFESLVELLRCKHAIDIVYFQDPVFNLLDVEFLESLSPEHRVIETPKSDEVLDDYTFLHASAEQDTVDISLYKAHPHIFWNNQQLDMRNSYMPNPFLPRGWCRGNKLSMNDERVWLKIRSSKRFDERPVRLALMKCRALHTLPSHDGVFREARHAHERDYFYYKDDSGLGVPESECYVGDENLHTHETSDSHWQRVKDENPTLVQDLAKQYGLPMPKNAEDENSALSSSGEVKETSECGKSDE